MTPIMERNRRYSKSHFETISTIVSWELLACLTNQTRKTAKRLIHQRATSVLRRNKKTNFGALPVYPDGIDCQFTEGNSAIKLMLFE